MVMKLDDILQVTAGPNASRIKNLYTEEQMYTVRNLEDDLAQTRCDSFGGATIQAELLTDMNDLVVSMIRQEAAVVSKANIGKVLSSNFVKCAFDSECVDPWFICYWLNESDVVKKMKYDKSILKSYTATTLLDLPVMLPVIAKQHAIGNSYKNLKHMQYLFDRQKDEWASLTLEMIHHALVEGK